MPVQFKCDQHHCAAAPGGTVAAAAAAAVGVAATAPVVMETTSADKTAAAAAAMSKFSFKASGVTDGGGGGEFGRHRTAFLSGTSPPTSPLSPTSSGNMSFLSVTPLSPPILRSELGGVVKAHTDNLDRYIAEIEATETTGSLPVMPKKQQKLPYIRRRYTGERGWVVGKLRYLWSEESNLI